MPLVVIFTITYDAQEVLKCLDSFASTQAPAVSGSKSRLIDSLETLGGVILNSTTVDNIERGRHHGQLPAIKRFCSLIVERMEIAIEHALY